MRTLLLTHRISDTVLSGAFCQLVIINLLSIASQSQWSHLPTILCEIPTFPLIM